MKIAFELKGVSPLLMHKDDIEEADRLEAWRDAPKDGKKKQKRGDDRSPPWTWHTYLYHDGLHVAMPSDNISVCLRQAGAKLPIKGTKTHKEITQSGLFFDADFQPLLVAGRQVPVADIFAVESRPFPDHLAVAVKLGFKLHMKRAKIPSGKNLRVRPCFSDWSVSGRVMVLDHALDLLTVETLSQIFELAGFIGLGDWRPGGKTPGRFGMFRLASLKQVK